MVYSEHTPVEQTQHKKHVNDQWRLLGSPKNIPVSGNPLLYFDLCSSMLVSHNFCITFYYIHILTLTNGTIKRTSSTETQCRILNENKTSLFLLWNIFLCVMASIIYITTLWYLWWLFHQDWWNNLDVQYLSNCCRVIEKSNSI